MPAGPICDNCNQAISDTDNYCPNCGAVRAKLPESWSENSFKQQAQPVAAFYIITLIICLIAGSFNIFHQYKYMLWIEISLAICTLAFAATRWRDILPLYSFRNVSLLSLIGFSLAAIPMSLAVGFVTGFINEKFYNVDITYITPYLPYDNTALIFILSIGVYPAVFEELGFRGFVFNSVRDVAGPSSAIVISSMSFAIMHQNLISLFWLVPFAFWLGYMRNKYDTIWYGVAAHFAFNTTACLVELYQYNEWPFS